MKRFRSFAVLFLLPLALNGRLFAGPRDVDRGSGQSRTPQEHGARVGEGRSSDLLSPIDEPIGDAMLGLQTGSLDPRAAALHDLDETSLRGVDATTISLRPGVESRRPGLAADARAQGLPAVSGARGGQTQSPGLSKRGPGSSLLSRVRGLAASDVWPKALGWISRERGDRDAIADADAELSARPIQGPIALGAPRPAQESRGPAIDAVALKPAAPAAPARRPWKVFTEKLSRWPTWLVFLALSMPQMWTNTVNLASAYPFFHSIVDGVNWGLAAANEFLPWQFGLVAVGNINHIAELPFIGALSNILADAMLMMFFTAKDEVGPKIVQTTGVIMMSVVLAQIWIAGFMPTPWAIAATAVIVPHLIINFMKFADKTRERFFFGLITWSGWRTFISVLGLYLLIPGIAVMFHAHDFPMIMNAALIAGLAPASGGLLLLKKSRMIRFYRFTRKTLRLPSSNVIRGQFKSPGGFLATVFFLTLPVALLLSVYYNPAEHMAGVNPYTWFLGMFGNLLMLPHAMAIRNAIWFIGSAWAVLGGLVVLGDLWLHGLASVGHAIAPWWLATGSIGLAIGVLGYALKRNTKALSEKSGVRKSVLDSLSFLRFWRNEKPS